MPLFLAQAAPDAAQLASWLAILFYLGGFIATLLGIAVAVKELRKKAAPAMPQPLEVKSHAAIASQDDIDQLHGRIKRERMEIDKRLTELKEEDDRLREKLDHEIENLQNRVDAVPGRVIELLRNTKNLI